MVAETSAVEAFFNGGGGGAKREPKARVERRRRETIRDNFKFRISEMPFPGLCKRLAQTEL